MLDIDIVELFTDPELLGAHVRDQETWRNWLVVLRALFALPLNVRERKLFEFLTSRKQPPTKQAREAWFVVGRRGGKSFIAAVIAVFLACVRDWSQFFMSGERGCVMILAADKRQARVILRYVRALIAQTPMLASLIERETQESIELKNGIFIEVHTASFRSVRGYSIVAAIADEIAFWRDEESSNPDVEVLNALRPAMATVEGSMLIGLSTPYRRSGVLYAAFRDHYGKEGSPILVVRADSRTMNPTVPESVISAAYEADPLAAAAEYGADFRSDVAGFLDVNWIERAIDLDRPPELPWRAEHTYRAFTDPSGGRHDSFVLSIAHREGPGCIVDVCRGFRPPFNPASAVAEFAALLKTYRIHEVVGDQYAGDWVAKAFVEHGIRYVASDRTKSSIYLEALPLFATGRVRLPDHRVLATELRQLERRTSPGGRDSVDHPPRSHDDFANAACGALLAVSRGSPIDLSKGILLDTSPVQEVLRNHPSDWFFVLDRSDFDD